MLIVCTQDPAVRNWANTPNSGAGQWGDTVLLCGSQEEATAMLGAMFGRLGKQEPLCLSAHGNDTEIGDEDEQGWTWTTTDIAKLFKIYNRDYNGPFLISACAKTVANFSAGLAVAMQHEKTCDELWVYGYNRPVDIEERFPDPERLSQRLDLQGTQVRY